MSTLQLQFEPLNEHIFCSVCLFGGLVLASSKHVNETENIAPRKKGNKRQKVVVNKTAGDPKWCKETSKNLRDLLKGPKEAECIERWETIEEVLGYQGQSRVSTYKSSRQLETHWHLERSG